MFIENEIVCFYRYLAFSHLWFGAIKTIAFKLV